MYSQSLVQVNRTNSRSSCSLLDYTAIIMALLVKLSISQVIYVDCPSRRIYSCTQTHTHTHKYQHQQLLQSQTLRLHTCIDVVHILLHFSPYIPLTVIIDNENYISLALHINIYLYIQYNLFIVAVTFGFMRQFIL